MSTSHLTTKYRPQTFSDVAGQEAVKAVLSRASAEDRIAPAYLFSGTRGVGKTTIARILAKAVNCENAPTGEPCNECRFCKQITAGTAVDVVEVDAASNRGIDDARRLKEDIGYAPLEARYKVFIIDEAHMLTREAFNALLKTLEEPPGRVLFILATTEAHKFPATIISRCQHYTFQRLSQAGLEAHLANILQRENEEFEPAAVSLIAKRGAGSVRDSMSLLAQGLALGKDVLTAADVRSILGLAGQDVFFEIFSHIHDRDCAALSGTLGEILDQGLDIGFFLRELGAGWRNMFLLRQSGDKALPVLGLADEEAALWSEWAGKFSLPHIHACWQLTLEGQRRVLTSLEPALALELLLFNLACLPDLVPLGDAESLGSAEKKTPESGPGSDFVTPPPGGTAQAARLSPSPNASVTSGAQQQASRPVQQAKPAPAKTTPPWEEDEKAEPAKPVEPKPESRPAPVAAPKKVEEPPAPAAAKPVEQEVPKPAPKPVPKPAEPKQAAPEPYDDGPPLEDLPYAPSPEEEWEAEGYAPAPPPKPDPIRTEVPRPAMAQPVEETPPAPAMPQGPTGTALHGGAPTWEGFCAYAKQQGEAEGKTVSGLSMCSGEVDGATLHISCKNTFHVGQLRRNGTYDALCEYAKAYYGDAFEVSLEAPEQAPQRSLRELNEDAREHPVIKETMERFGARIVDIRRTP